MKIKANLEVTLNLDAELEVPDDVYDDLRRARFRGGAVGRDAAERIAEMAHWHEQLDTAQTSFEVESLHVVPSSCC